MAKPVALIEQGEIKGLAGTTDGDYLRWNSTTGAWESQAGSGGGGVSSVGATAPLASSGGSNPTISLTAGSNAQVLISNGSAYSSQTVSGDATITNTGAVTVTGLQGNDVSASTPASGQTLVWSSGANAWVPGASAASGSGGGGVTLYLNQANAAGSPTTNLPANTKQLGLTAVASQSSIAKTNISTASWDLVADFVTDSTEAYTSIPAGIWDFNVYVNSTAQITQQSYFRISVYAYDGSTDPLAGTLLAQSANIYMYDANVIAQYTASVLFSAETFSPAKRIFVRLEVRAQQSNHNATFYFGNATASHTHTTLPSVTGTGLVKVVDGVFQSPASTLVNADVAANAAIGVSKLANGSSGQILVAGASNLAYQTMSGDATMASTGALTLANSGVAANTYGSASSVPVTTVDAKGRVTGVTDTPIAISASQVTSGTLGVANGGTGASTLADRAVLVGNGTAAITSVGPLTDGQLLIGSTGGDPVAASLTGTANQITVTNATGQITLSTPQDIATTSSPTFAGASIATTGSGTTTIGNTTSGGAVAIRTAKANALTVTPGSVSLTCATQSTFGVAGGSVAITAAYSDYETGGNVTVSGGIGPTAGNISLLAGDSNTAGGSGGAITLTSGDGYASSGPCPSGDVTIQTGAGGFQSNAGSISILGGTGFNTTTSESTGNITIRAGQNTWGQAGITSGTVTIQGGCDLTGVTATIPGYVRIRGGDMNLAGNLQPAGLVEIRGGNNVSTNSGANGGAVSITGGNGRLGGTVTIQPGQSSTGSGAGYVLIRGSTAGSANTSNGGVSILGGRSATGFTVNVATSTSDYLNIGSSSGGSTYTGIPTLVRGMLCLPSTSQTVVASGNFAPLTSYLRIGSLAAVTVSGNFDGTFADGALLLIRNTGGFTITIPAGGAIRTLTNGAKALAAGGTITVQYDALNDAWYECATVLNAS